MQKSQTHPRAASATRFRRGVRRFIRQWDLQLMVIPAMLFIFLFSYVPMYGVLMSFQDYDIFRGFASSPWVGLKHFEALFHAPEFPIIMRNTVCISLFKLIVGFPAPIILALLLNEVMKLKFKKAIQTVSYLPHFLSWVIVGGFMGSLLSTDNGSVNMALQALGVIDDPINFLAQPNAFWTILVATNVWKNIGFASIVYLAAITGVDPGLYEAAAIDGAGKWRQIFSVTLPSILPVIIIYLILDVGDLLNAGFEDILQLGHNPVLRDVSEVIDTYVYRTGLQNYRYSYATAAGLFKSVISVGLMVGVNALARKTDNSLW